MRLASRKLRSCRRSAAAALVGSLGLLAQPLAAQEVLSLTGALERGRTGARETVAANARQRAAEAKAKEAFGYRLPQVRISERCDG